MLYVGSSQSIHLQRSGTLLLTAPLLSFISLCVCVHVISVFQTGLLRPTAIGGGGSGCYAGDSSLTFDLHTFWTSAVMPAPAESQKDFPVTHTPSPLQSIVTVTRDHPPSNILLHYWTEPSPALQSGCELLICVSFSPLSTHLPSRLLNLVHFLLSHLPLVPSSCRLCLLKKQDKTRL